MSDITNALELMPTHFCQTCGARWRQLDDGRWNLRSPRCEPCCDNGPAFNLMPLVMAYDALRGQLHDEIAANHAFRDAGGALPYEDMPTFCDRLIRERAALEAEKAERERQEPVAWAWDDALGCMHVHCGSRRPVWVDGECSDATRAEMKLRPLYARPLPARSDRDCAHYTFVGWLGPRGIFIEDEIYQAWKGHRKDPSAAQYRKVYAAPPIQRQDPSPVPHVDPDWLANVIRRSDPRMTMTSDELAEKIAEAINGRTP